MRDGEILRRTFGSLAAAKKWRVQATNALEDGTLKGDVKTSVDDAAREFIDGARSGLIRNRVGQPYKPASVRGYDRSLRLHVLPALGHLRLSHVRRRHVQDLVDDLMANGLAGSTVKNACDPLRRIFDRALKRDLIAVDPTDGIEWPASSRCRDRIATPAEAQRLLDALPEDDCALWATALYAGLRRGELRALRWSAVDFGKKVINVERGWDDVGGDQEGKTRAARRRVPLVPDLRKLLRAHELATGRRGSDLVFGISETVPFEPSTLRRRALKAWRDADFRPIGLHECRHTFASLMIAADVNIKALSTYMGHTSVTTTLDLYGHLLPNAEDEAADRLQSFLDRQRGETA
ncbi:MAG TPA: tyrosine-type recombinase/integrase [Thermoleophilaceae bacterium]|nr:tyrosine-type recombinase/integrase [Thermoleophilaceae bacterium]